MKITFVNVGYGEGIVISYQDKIIVIDTGSNLLEEYEGYAARISIDKYLKNNNISKIDALVLTHLHEDHICRGAKLIDDYEISQIYTNIDYSAIDLSKEIIPNDTDEKYTRLFAYSTNAYRHIILKALENNIPIHKLYYEKDKQIMIAGVLKADVLGPNLDVTYEFEKNLKLLYKATTREDITKYSYILDKSANATPIMLRLHFGDKKVLLTSDLVPNNLKYLPDDIDISSDILKLAHHGQIDGIEENFLKKVSANMYITCSSSNRINNSSHKDVYKNIRQMFSDSKFYFTDEISYDDYFKVENKFSALNFHFTHSGIEVSFDFI
ncbi:MAG: hypothetical protein BEN19_03135 [Epulopiscium sp. Nuni2H_MBin003]|nr:MAG: hypothetical protein BEN19_03135 [Epulopiscium sp. Nuni2H_MBin003]